MNKDNIYQQAQNQVADFSFDKKVANVFPDMIQRSVPGYSHVISMIGLLAGKYAQPNSNLYDLGCSLGAVTAAMRHNVNQTGCKVIAVDNSQAMLDKCEVSINSEESMLPAKFVLADISTIDIKNASVVVLNFTLQFIALEKRQALLNKIYQGMPSGGVLIISEKLHFDDVSLNELMIENHHQFKRANGYSDLEIAQKRSAIENVLIPETWQTHENRLKEIGFAHPHIWFQSLNFCSYMAIK
ncbi:MAG: carboxy-S-adenosyl-L-methionine synthase CmoA [Saccharospirillaceae bacterium]|nr:carboxy-S-adenosyl-L-methionine synthase CmoA [Pseudomonadales bacterium]NRB79800.1 carboxy-S-adenosyl-L-methionine synthase CmoA [Saccharospirillaceae bacterium]